MRTHPASQSSEGAVHKSRPRTRTTEASGTLKVPRSPYELLPGTVIAAALLTGIDSDLPGEVMASVTESVYDTVTGQLSPHPAGEPIDRGVR